MDLARKQRNYHRVSKAPHEVFSPTRTYANGRQRNGAFGSSPWGFESQVAETDRKGWFEQLKAKLANAG